MREIQEVPGKVTIKTAFRDYFKGYFDFMGRSTRPGYWWVMGIIILILYIPLFILLGQLLITKGHVAGINPWIYLGIFAIIAVGIFIPTLALSIRRYRDAGLNGRGAVTLWVLNGLASSYSQQSRGWAFISAVIGLALLITVLLKTNQLETDSDNPLVTFFLRAKVKEN
ncbi:DUF805 domain-containing protein [Latilactobacillus sakei]|uniref:DUF805 domain-containing protein n=1 Tax=Latilactobacillus sakei TaxID=1599 RepID=A0AAX0VCY0_LATSK|nr:DUF805 domain-containing protein [Latilactobacillus sakei]ASN13093.1 DUF805 domain-containing protein [Latilactobacillus sakei]EOR84416.1 putative membrane protein [Latilactobacillus sakei subsp. sakei LS25]PKX63740.1 DUF805 domain-containing protein [Latilactobacillus sakei]PKX67826.1 DUF805 domain-containing protein [Latilactobacillus sakei]PKX72372.1 DUF805 domain-containing protein [Latilactobacillus sakei]